LKRTPDGDSTSRIIDAPSPIDYGEAGGNIIEPEMTQSGPNLINPIAMDKGLKIDESPERGQWRPGKKITMEAKEGDIDIVVGKISANDIKPKEREYKGHVTLLKREAPPSPPSEPSNLEVKSRRVEMAKAGITEGNPQEGKISTTSSVEPEGHSTKDKDKDKEKESKKEFVGHVTLLK
jgi:hypothetical protein